MKLIKNVTLMMAFIGAMSITGCKSDPCETVICENNGICEEGICDCAPWFEGSSCSVETREQYMGTYFDTILMAGIPMSISFDITTYPGNVQRLNWSDDFYLALSGNGGFNVPAQTVTANGVTNSVEGTGSFNGNVMIMDLMVTMDGVQSTVNYNMTK